MRLTLRTLLAWLDDTLEPNQVREIGKQVAESPFAQELSDRIHRVTRQRRLSVPTNSGADAVDPNIVASYLDNDLDAESVAEFEKKCLTSDVNLAEVGSVHQILSLLGQKVQVPPEARQRMYQLVKGRETIARKRPSKKRSPAPEPVTKPIQPWVTPDAPKRPLIERFGPALACLVLIALSSWSAWKSVTSPSALQPPTLTMLTDNGVVQPAVTFKSPAAVETRALPAGEGATEASKAAALGGDAAKPGPERARDPNVVDRANPSPDRGTAGSLKEAKPPAVEKAKDAAVPAVPSGYPALAEKSDGILLIFNNDERTWERLAEATPLSRSNRVLCLTPFRASIAMGKIRIALVGETEVRVLSAAADPVPALELARGRLLIRQPQSSALKVVFANRAATLDMPPESIVALERIEPRAYGQPTLQPPPLAVCCIQGDVSLTVDNRHESLKPSNVAVIDGGQVRITTPDNLPSWATQLEPSPYELQMRDQFVKLFHPGRPVPTDLDEAVADDRPEIKRLAVSALKALGDLSLLMPVLSRDHDPIARRSAIDAIRSYMALGPEASARVRAQLDEEFGENLAALAQHMLVGFSADEVARGEVYPRLVSLLGQEQASVGIRELALDALKRLTGRDDLGYDPDQPRGKGLDAWVELLRHNELRPLAPRPGKPQ